MGALIGVIVNAIIGPLISEGAGVWKQYLNNEITREKLAENLKEIMTKSALDAYKAQLDTAFKVYDSFQQSLRNSKTVRQVWAICVLSQLAFIVWLEMAVPALVTNGFITEWSVGSLDKWAMGFVGASLGISPIILRTPKPPTV